MSIIQAQLAVFYNDQVNMDFDGLSYFIRSKLKESFNITIESNPALIGLPKEAPAEIPRVQLLSNDQTCKLQISYQRADLFLEKKVDEECIDLSRFVLMIDEVFNAHNLIKKKINRVGLISTKLIKNSNPDLYIAENYLNSARVTDIQSVVDVNVSYNVPFTEEGLKFNSLTSLASAVESLTNVQVVLLQRDINTLPMLDFETDYNLEVMKKAFLSKSMTSN